LKQLIVLVAVFILLVPIVLQISTENVTYAKKNAVEFYASNATEKAKQEGCYTDEIISNMLDEISKKLRIDRESIVVDKNTTKIVKYRLDKYSTRGEIYLKISVPFKKIIASADFFNINDDGYYIVEKMTLSEKIK